MISIDNVSFLYSVEEGELDSNIQVNNSLKNINCDIKQGEFVLVCGTSGCGKTTFTRLINGLIPHFYEGDYKGSSVISKQDTRDLSIFDLSLTVGSVFQNPRSQFFNVDTTSELAFGPENHGMEEDKVKERIINISSILDLNRLLNKSIFSLSGGEKQKIACGSVATIEPEIYVLDEPSSNLDIMAVNGLKKLLQELKSQGKTIVVSEHRLYYLKDLIDRVVYMKDGKIHSQYNIDEFKLLPKEMREEMGLRPISFDELFDIPTNSHSHIKTNWIVENMSFSYSPKKSIVNIPYLEIPGESITAIIGFNGTGKSTFLKCLCGLEKKCKGSFSYKNEKIPIKKRLKRSYMVMQDVNHQLFSESVLDEVLLSMEKPDKSKAFSILDEMKLLPYENSHPLSLSGGQKQRVAIASAIASERELLLLDEPTSGLDLFHMREISASVKKSLKLGCTVLIVSHDLEFILRTCHQVIHMENGEVLDSYKITDNKGKERLINFFKALNTKI